jgi:DNA replication protein DnaD
MDLTCMEIFRWGFANVPGTLFQYAHELELDMEDMGFLTVIMYVWGGAHGLVQRGVSAGQILRLCPSYSSNKVAKRLYRLQKLGLIIIKEEGQSRHLANKLILIDPLFERLTSLVRRDHQGLFDNQAPAAPDQEAYAQRVRQLESELAAYQEEDRYRTEEDSQSHVAKFSDFIAGKTGKLLSSAMTGELNKWLNDYHVTPELLYCMLELCFERGIENPYAITRIVKDTAKYQINTLDGLEAYFNSFIDHHAREGQWSYEVELIELSKYLNIDMQAEARRNVYIKWRNEWDFDQNMILKAGELMCSRTTKGGLEYMDSILGDWLKKGIKDTSAVEKEVARYRRDKRKQKPVSAVSRVPESEAYDLYIPKDELSQLKSV